MRPTRKLCTSLFSAFSPVNVLNLALHIAHAPATGQRLSSIQMSRYRELDSSINCSSWLLALSDSLLESSPVSLPFPMM
jgi:hypothetical protein